MESEKEMAHTAKNENQLQKKKDDSRELSSDRESSVESFHTNKSEFSTAAESELIDVDEIELSDEESWLYKSPKKLPSTDKILSTYKWLEKEEDNLDVQDTKDALVRKLNQLDKRETDPSTEWVLSKSTPKWHCGELRSVIWAINSFFKLLDVKSRNSLNRVPLRMDFTEMNSRGKRGELLERIDRQNSRFRTAKTTIIKFGLHASFVELESAKNVVNEKVGLKCHSGPKDSLKGLVRRCDKAPSQFIRDSTL
ncbi:uncharacterized protein TNCV_4142921 [Trichonephila clavipes]|nr:uncharacterized protein TNCV_4142921 [Trichonephila clavipes]